mgnify:FL=1
MSKIIERYNSQTCIGYSSDFEITYFRSSVRYTDGTEEVIVEERRDFRTPNILDSSFVPAIPAMTIGE